MRTLLSNQEFMKLITCSSADQFCHFVGENTALARARPSRI